MFLKKTFSKYLTNLVNDDIIQLLNAMRERSSIGIRFQRAWGGVSRVSEPM